jgi:hypothetical protein
MTTFLLSHQTTFDPKGEPVHGRVILDIDSHGEVLGSFEGDATVSDTGRVIESAWCAARAKIDESKFFQIPGEGWFFKATAKKEAEA